MLFNLFYPRLKTQIAICNIKYIMKVEITKSQLEAIADMVTTLESSLGAGGDIDSPEIDTYDKDCVRNIKLIDKFFVKNGYCKVSNL